MHFKEFLHDWNIVDRWTHAQPNYKTVFFFFVSLQFNLQSSAELQIYSRLKLTPKVVVLPFDPNAPRRQKVQFHVSGGDGSYIWSSDDLSLIQISQTGSADTRLDTLKGSGLSLDSSSTTAQRLTSISVALSRNTKIKETANVLFLPPIKLEIVGYNFETALGDYVKLHIGLFAERDGTLLPYTVCDNLDFGYEYSNKIFVHEETPTGEKDKLVPNACRLVYLKASNIGMTNLKVTYNFLGRELKDEVTLVVFEHLTIISPETNEIILPIGASRNVIYENGPKKVYNIEAELKKNIKFDKQLTDVEEVNTDFSDDRLVINVLCKKVGDQVVQLSIFNQLTNKIAIPYENKFETKVLCVKPRFLNLYTTDKLKTGCPLRRKNVQMHVKTAHDTLEVDIEVLDAHNRRLQNISSLAIDWAYTQADGAQLDQVPYQRVAETEDLDGVVIPKRDVLKTGLDDFKLNFKLKGIVTRYESTVLDHYDIYPERPHFGIQKTPGSSFATPLIENELSFLSVERTLLPFEHVSIFLSPLTVERIKIAQGSGYYDIKPSAIGIADVSFDEPNRQLVIVPKKIGTVQVSVWDRCLSTDPSVLTISVVSIGRIELHAPERVEKTKEIEGVLKLYDSQGELIRIDHSNLQMYRLQEELLDEGLLSIRLGSQENLNVGEIR